MKNPKSEKINVEKVKRRRCDLENVSSIVELEGNGGGGDGEEGEGGTGL